jgi:hypothetical protein
LLLDSRAPAVQSLPTTRSQADRFSGGSQLLHVDLLRSFSGALNVTIRRARWWFLIVLMAGVCAQALPRPPARADDTPDSDRPDVVPSQLEWKGVASCNSTQCHGANRNERTWENVFRFWEQDAHSLAFKNLKNDASANMVKNLYGPKALPAPKTPLCLRCHSIPAEARIGEADARTAGVSCEHCHGPAQVWWEPHAKPSWKAKSAEVKERKYGMAPLKDLKRRAEKCAECHVGNSDQEVNHDLIAAGHPRMNFEMYAIHSEMPRHWAAENDAGLPAHLWAVGQLATAQAALEVLASRASPANKKPWPEFAEYDCYACHHDLREPSWRQQRGYEGRRPGSLPWQNWYYDKVGLALAGRLPEEVQMEWLAAEQKLRAEMQKTWPRREEIAAQAGTAAKQLKTWLPMLNKVEFDNVKNVKLLQAQCRGLAGPETKAPLSWDLANQRYFAFFALSTALERLEQPDPEFKKIRADLRGQLATPKDYNSPRDFDPTKKRETPKEQDK